MHASVRSHFPAALVTLHAGYNHSSLALRSIAAYCAGAPFGAGVRLFETTLKGRRDWLLAELVAGEPALVGFSTYLWNITESLHLARLLKTLRPATHIVFGGPEAGPRGEELLGEHPWLDFVVEGEGEHAFRDLGRWLLANEGDPEAVSGLIWRQAGRIRRNPIRLLDPRELPSPFDDPAQLDKPLVYWETSRGCPFKCSFCTSATDRLRTLPEGRIDRDLAVIRQLEGRTIKLLDRSFHLGAERTTGLLARFVDTPESVRFHLELNPDRVSEQALALFATAPPGKFQFEIGLQTLEAPVLELISRRMDIDKALANIRALVAQRRHPVHVDLIVGLPREDAEQCRRSLDRTFLLFADHLQLGTLKLLPGTPLRAQAHEFGYRWDPEPPYEILGHATLEFEQLMRFKAYAELLERLWNSGLCVHTLTRLVPTHFDGSVATLFDWLLAGGGRELVTERPHPDRVFQLLTEALTPLFERDPTLTQLWLWDYAHYGQPNRQTPPWLRTRLQETARCDGRALPVLHLDAAAAAVVDARRREPLGPGRYALWARKDRRGRPVTIYPLGVAPGADSGCADGAPG